MGMHSNGLPNVCTQGPRLSRELLQGPSAPVPQCPRNYRRTRSQPCIQAPLYLLAWLLEFTTHGVGLVHQHCHCFIVLIHQGDGKRKRQNSNRFRLPKQQPLQVHNAFCIFFCHRCTTRKKNFLISRRVREDKNDLLFLFLNRNLSQKQIRQHLTKWTRWNKSDEV